MAGIEHALFLILLLSYLLRGLPGRHPANLYLIAGGLLLALLPPFIRVEIPWNLILALVLPWIFWQNARSWLKLEWRLSRREVYLWLIFVLSLGMIVAFIGNSPWLRAIFFGMIAASMLWQVSSQEGISNPLSNIGSLTLVFLLVATSLAMDDPRHSVGSLFSGAGVGMAFALLSIAVTKKVSPKYKSWISLGQVYLAYWAALAIAASAIAAALISVVAFAEFSLHRLDIKEPNMGSNPLNNRFTFFIALALFIFTAWQTHQPATFILWLEAGLGLCISFLITLLGRRWGLPRFEHLSSAWRSVLPPGLFLLGTLILWPRGSELGPAIIWIALGSAVFLPVLSAILLAAMHDLTNPKG
jgi:hypothetical protein